MKHQTILARLVAIIAIGLIVVTPVLALSGTPNRTAGLDGSAPWRAGYSLVILSPDADPVATTQALRSAGMEIALALSPRAVLGWPQDVERIRTVAGVQAVFDTRIEESVAGGDASLLQAIRFFNSALDGSLGWNQASDSDSDPLINDELAPSALERDAYRDNLQAQGMEADGIEAAGDSGAMVGTVAVNVIFVESNGSVDANKYTWTDAAVQQTLSKMASALSWWSEQAGTRGVTLSFYVNSYLPTDTRCQTGYEPILHSSTQANLWMEKILGNLGYRSGNVLTRATSLNAWAKNQFHTNSAYTVFVEYNPFPAPDRFTDGYSAWSYIGGPMLNALYRSFGWSFDRTFAHETGHIFHACDEYYKPGYGGCGGCTACSGTVPNGNCEACNPSAVPCIMRANSWALCDFTMGQIGWGMPTGLVTTGAKGITLNQSVTSTTAGAINNQSSYPITLIRETGPEAVYRLVLDSVRTFTVTLSGLASNLDVLVLSGSTPDTCLAYGDSTATVTAAPAGAYMIVVDGQDGDSGAFTLTVSAPSDLQTLSVPVQAGWNLLSLPVLSSSTPITQALSSLTGKYDAVYVYDAADAGEPWRVYTPGQPGAAGAQTVDGHTAFWLHMTEAGVLTARGAGSTGGVALNAGWNLVPYTGRTAASVTDALGSVASKVDRVIEYDSTEPDSWRTYSRSAPSYASTVSVLQPGRGYWVFANATCVWTPAQ